MNDDDIPENNPEIADNGEADVEARARRMGWRPESEWDDSRGGRRPPKFLSPAEYIYKVENDIPVLRERLRTTDAEREEFRGEVKELRQRLTETSDLVKTLHEQARESGRRGYERAYRDLQREQREAVAEADTDKFERAQKAMEDLQREVAAQPIERAVATPPEPPKPTPSQVEPETRAWIAANRWFNADPVLNAMAIEVETRVRRDSPGMVTSEVLAEVKAEVMERFPEKFGINPRRAGAGAVATPSAPRSARSTTGRDFGDLPEDAQRTFRALQKQFKDKGIEYKPEEYVADYQWE